MDKKRWIVYLIRCDDESLYCGITNNLKNRLIAHNSGRGAKYTKSRRPVELVAASAEMTKSDALKVEYRVKQVPAGKKNLEFTDEENRMTKKLKKDLQSVSKALYNLVQKIEKMQKEVDKQVQPTKKTKAETVKKKAVKKAPVKKVIVPKTAPPTAIDKIFAIINRSKKGVNTSTLMEKTGYERKAIFNVIYKLTKQGKIKTVAKGVYVKA
jgi:putative endonuclease